MSMGLEFIGLGILVFAFQGFVFRKTGMGVAVTSIILFALGTVMLIAIVLGYVLNPPTMIVI